MRIAATLKQRKRSFQSLSILLLGGVWLLAAAGQDQQVQVGLLKFNPVVDGDLTEWRGLEHSTIIIAPAIEEDKRNHTGTIAVKLWAGRDDAQIYIAAQWPDDAADTDYRPWHWRGSKYRRSKRRDDMFALRFALSGNFNRSMIADADYSVDVWVWSAGRSNRIGLASDYRHRISLTMIEDAPEYETADGNTVYIDRIQDHGEIGFHTIKPGKTQTESQLPSIDFTRAASGSVADVAASGRWRDGLWTLELRRSLDTGHDDDVRFTAGQEILGQIAVFNKNGAQHKSVSEPLLFKFPL